MASLYRRLRHWLDNPPRTPPTRPADQPARATVRQALFIVVVALVVVVVSGAAAVQRVLWFDLISTEGTVVDVDPGVGGGITTYTIEFSDVDGQSHVVEGHIEPTGSSEGVSAEVWYDPDDPTSVATPTDYVLWTGTLVAIALLALLLAFAATRYVVGKPLRLE